MDDKNLKVLTTADLIRAFGRTDLLPIKVERDFFKKLKINLIVLSANQAF